MFQMYGNLFLYADSHLRIPLAALLSQFVLEFPVSSLLVFSLLYFLFLFPRLSCCLVIFSTLVVSSALVCSHLCSSAIFYKQFLSPLVSVWSLFRHGCCSSVVLTVLSWLPVSIVSRSVSLFQLCFLFQIYLFIFFNPIVQPGDVPSSSWSTVLNLRLKFQNSIVNKSSIVGSEQLSHLNETNTKM